MDGEYGWHLSTCIAPDLTHRYRQLGPVQRHRTEAKTKTTAKNAETAAPVTRVLRHQTQLQEEQEVEEEGTTEARTATSDKNRCRCRSPSTESLRTKLLPTSSSSSTTTTTKSTPLIPIITTAAAAAAPATTTSATISADTDTTKNNNNHDDDDDDDDDTSTKSKKRCHETESQLLTHIAGDQDRQAPAADLDQQPRGNIVNNLNPAIPRDTDDDTDDNGDHDKPTDSNRRNWHHHFSRTSVRPSVTSPLSTKPFTSVLTPQPSTDPTSYVSSSDPRRSTRLSPVATGQPDNICDSSGTLNSPAPPVSPLSPVSPVHSAGSRKSNDTSTSAVVAPLSPSLASRLTPAFAVPPSWSPPTSPRHLSFFHHSDNTAPAPSRKRLHPVGPLRWHEPQNPPLSPGPGIEPVRQSEVRTFLRDHYERMSKQSQYQIPDYVPPVGSSAFHTMSGVMTSNETLLSSSVDRSGGASTASNTNSVASKAPVPNAKPLITRYNRTFIADPTLPYPLPVDLTELHRQSIRTLLMFQLFGGPVLTTAFSSKPPTRVLEIGCGSGFWSMMCHRYFAQHGHSSISFTGLDVIPLAGSGSDRDEKPDKDMQWRFVQHDVRSLPWPFLDGEFDLIIVKEMSMASSYRDAQPVMDEYLRVLRPGGVLEVWETDTTIRMLRPQVMKSLNRHSYQDDSDSSENDDDDNGDLQKMGAYPMTTNTPMSPPQNSFLVEYNGWVTKALELRGLSAVPCTLLGAYVLQEAEVLTDVLSKRLAVPLSEIRWEREGVGGVVTKDGKSYINSQKDGRRNGGGGKSLTAAQAALRRTALESTVGLILSLESVLRDVSGKSQEDWDSWAGKMVNDLLREGGTSWGECLEIGVWSSRKRQGKI